MSDALVSFVVVIVGPSNKRDGMAVVESTPYWEYPETDRAEAIAQSVVAWCNKHFIAPDSVLVRPINT